MPEIRKATRKVQKTAKDLAPVYPSPKVLARADQGLTRIDPNHVGGSLRESIHTKMYPKQLSGVVYTTLEYGPHQEFGTVYQTGTPFMLPAMNIERAGIQASMKSYLKKQIAIKAKK